MNKELTADLERLNYENHTGILVRAKGPDGYYGSFDIAQLDQESLHSWLRSHGEKNLWAENVVMILLQHPTQITES